MKLVFMSQSFIKRFIVIDWFIEESQKLCVFDSISEQTWNQTIVTSLC